MDELFNIELEGIDNYFNALSKLGYLNNNNVDSLLIISFLEESMTKYFNEYITDNDYNNISKAIECIAGRSCLIRAPRYYKMSDIKHEIKNSPMIRITENHRIRVSEDSNIRVIDDGI